MARKQTPANTTSAERLVDLLARAFKIPRRMHSVDCECGNSQLIGIHCKMCGAKLPEGTKYVSAEELAARRKELKAQAKAALKAKEAAEAKAKEKTPAATKKVAKRTKR